MKREYLLVVVWLLVCIISVLGCDDNLEISGNESENATSKVVEVATSVDGHNQYLELFNVAIDNNDYSKKYENGGLSVEFEIINKPKNSVVIYEGNPISLEINGKVGFDTTIGYLVFINGVPQVYYTDSNNEKLYMHFVAVDKNCVETVVLNIEPNAGKKGEEMNMIIVPLVGAKYRPLGAHDIMKPECGAGMLLAQYKIEMKVDGNVVSDMLVKEVANIAYTEYELSEFIYTRADGSIENKLSTPLFDSQFDRNIIENNKLRLFTEFGGGGAGEYIVCAYVNGILLQSYRCNIVDYNSRVVINDTITFSEDMIKEYDIKDYNSFYYIAVPVDSKTNGGKQVQSTVGIVVMGKEVLK